MSLVFTVSGHGPSHPEGTGGPRTSVGTGAEECRTPSPRPTRRTGSHGLTRPPIEPGRGNATGSPTTRNPRTPLPRGRTGTGTEGRRGTSYRDGVRVEVEEGRGRVVNDVYSRRYPGPRSRYLRGTDPRPRRPTPSYPHRVSRRNPCVLYPLGGGGDGEGVVEHGGGGCGGTTSVALLSPTRPGGRSPVVPFPDWQHIDDRRCF